MSSSSIQLITFTVQPSCDRAGSMICTGISPLYFACIVQRLQVPKNRPHRELIMINICEVYFFLWKWLIPLHCITGKRAAEPQRGEGQSGIVSVFGHPQQQELLYFSHVLDSPTLQWLMRFKWKSCSGWMKWLELQAAALHPLHMAL